MPLSADDFINENSGTTAASTSLVASLPATTAGNTVVVILAGTAVLPSGVPTGFATGVFTGPVAVYYKSDVGAGETSWTFTFGGVETCSWYAAEMSNVDSVEPVDVSATNAGASAGNGGTVSTGTTALNGGVSTVAFAVWHTAQTAGEGHSWSGYTNGFEEVLEVGPGAGTGVVLAVARKFQNGTTGTFSTTGTFATTGPTEVVNALVVALRAADSPVVAPLTGFLGFEWGTHGGLGQTIASGGLLGGTLGPAGTMGTNYIVQAGSARTGSYGFRVVQTGSTHYSTAHRLNTTSASYGFNVRVVSATGTVIVAESNTNVTDRLQLVYNPTTTKFGLRWGASGTVSYQSGTTALNTWVWIDIRLKVSTATHHAEWRIETGANTYTDQTPPADEAETASTITDFCMGGLNVTQTVTADFDDVCASRYYASYPLGPHQIRLLTVDPAGTPSVSGTTANFNVFTANGTLAAWNATNARNAVDEVPPTISASADGVCQVTNAASDYVEFPMSTYTLGPTEAIVGVRGLAPEWGGTGSGTGTQSLRGWDGTAETVLFAGANTRDPDSLTAVSSTHPKWMSGYWPGVNGWTQAELDAAALRTGFSADATPDMGVHAVYLEVAIATTKTRQLFGDLASLEADPHRLGIVSITVDAPAGVDTGVTYEVGGSPTTMTVPGGTSDTDQINAVFEPDVNYISGETEAEPDPVD